MIVQDEQTTLLKPFIPLFREKSHKIPVFYGVPGGTKPSKRTKCCTDCTHNLHGNAMPCAQIAHAIKISLHELCTLSSCLVHDFCTGFCVNLYLVTGGYTSKTSQLP
jgi:hypothetical protein